VAPVENEHSSLAAGVQRLDGRQTVALARHEVLGAMAWRGMHAARALLQGDVIGEDHPRLAVNERVLCDAAIQLRTGRGGEHLQVLPARGSLRLLQEALG
jgi:hypothetical protein